METSAGVSCVEFFSFQSQEQRQEFIVIGYEDGQMHVYDLTKNHNQSHKKLVFNI